MQFFNFRDFMQFFNFRDFIQFFNFRDFMQFFNFRDFMQFFNSKDSRKFSNSRDVSSWNSGTMQNPEFLVSSNYVKSRTPGIQQLCKIQNTWYPATMSRTPGIQQLCRRIQKTFKIWTSKELYEIHHSPLNSTISSVSVLHLLQCTPKP